MRLLILGATGMLGSAALRWFMGQPGIDVTGAARSPERASLLPPEAVALVRTRVELDHEPALARLIAEERPDAVLNAAGVLKRGGADAEAMIRLNALLPHRLARLCGEAGARLIHISTDCVFRGDRGCYREDDTPDADDLYGRSKLLGEPAGAHVVTLRTSIIGHELGSARGLVEWFLAQPGPVHGYARAVFSGLPTVELARVIGEVALPRPDLSGVWHVAAAPTSKLELLRLVGATYRHPAAIIPDDAVQVDRSLDASRFCAATGWQAHAWPEMVDAMRAFG